MAVVLLTPIFAVSAEILVGPRPLWQSFNRALALAVAILVGYELFFAAQRAQSHRRPIIVSARIDDAIPFVVHWVWVYGALYYLLVCFPAGVFFENRAFFLFIAGGVAILLVAIPVHVLWPTMCAPAWRSYARNGASAAFLSFIQTFDNGTSCLPSLHTAFAAYAATFYPWPAALVVVPALVGVSCVLVKQHSVLDIVPSVFYGYSVGWIVNALL